MNFAEAEAFLERRLSARRPRFDLDRLLFGPQRDFVRDPATFATALCTRRAGKTVGVAAWLLEGPLQPPHAPSLYFTITRKEAKRIVWPVMLKMNREERLGYVPNESDLILKRDGVPAVFLMGVDSRDEIEKARGTGWGRVVGDEAQTLPAHVEEMVNDVLMPSFMDHDGKLRLIGTPGAMPVGFFHKATQNPEWAHHSWTVWDNPHLPNAREKLAEVLRARGVREDDPSIQREWFGRWVLDVDSLVFHFDPARNVFDSLPACVKPWSYVVGCDLGYEDADAIAVLAFNDDSPNSYLVEEIVERKQSISALADKLQDVVKRYEPLSIVVDTGGLGKKIAEEVGGRTGLPLKAAEKQRKFEFIELLNDAMRTGRFYAKPGSRFVEDAMLVEWDRDKSTNDRLVISDRFHSDIGDAVLYAFRESLHWLHEPPPPPGSEHGTPEWFQAEEERLEREAEEKLAERQREAGELDWGSWQ